MRAAALRRSLGPVILALALLGPQATAHAQLCTSSCSRARGVCAMQAHTALSGCLHGCAFGDFQCRAACMASWRATRTTCRATRTDCMTTCPPAAATSMVPCATGCSATAKTCFAEVLASGATCAVGCTAGGGGDLKSCLEQCAAAIGAQRTTCLAAFQGCAAGCQGQGAGACFSTLAMECTAQPCGPGQPCTQPDEFCSERCATSPPSGTCLDLATGQCTGATCSPNQPCAATGQTCVPLCPPPTPQGKCYDPTAKACTDQACDTTHGCVLANQICTLQCPMRTPVPQCASVPCGGPCAVLPPCPSGAPCPEFSNQLGQCASDAAGVCGCVLGSPPATRTPQPTRTAPCDAAACGGPCAIGLPFPCPDGKVCAGPDIALQGQCAITANGSCDCVPVSPTPPGTPTPQCGGDTCGGPCVIAPSCPPGALCPEVAWVVRPGACTSAADGSCQCVPSSPLPTGTPRPTRTPQCNGAMCGGPCTVEPPVVCPDNNACEGSGDAEIQGQCAIAADGSCDCVPIRPTPQATPTPQCGGPMCGGPCVIGSSCPPGEVCPAGEFVLRRGECAAGANGDCQCVPLSPRPTTTPFPTRTPQCGGAVCGGACTIGFPFPCPDGTVCDGPNAPDLLGQCAISTDGSCECVPVRPTPPATPTPQCSDAMCGGSCVLVPTCPPGKICPARALVVRPGQCMTDAAGACECVAVVPPTRTPGCIPLFTSGCSQTSDCCEPCGNGTIAPCGVCINGTCEGAP